MDSTNPKEVFAQTLKRWFKANGWPQAITDSWAKDPGIQAPSGPWASQICGAMKADFHPRVEFFLAMARFNQYVADQDLKSITASKLRDRLKGAKPLATDAGQLYGPTDFFGLFTGLIDPPKSLAESEIKITQEDVDEWHEEIRGMFKEIAINYMLDRPAAWEMVQAKIIEEAHGNNNHEHHDDLMWIKEILSGFRDATIDECVRCAKRFGKGQPLMTAMEALLGKTQSPLVKGLVGRARRSSAPLPSFADGMGFRGLTGTSSIALEATSGRN